MPFPKFCMCSSSPFTPRPCAHLHIYVCVHMLRLHVVQATSIYGHSCITCEVHGHPQAQNPFLTRLTPRGPSTDLSACPSSRLKVMPSAPIPGPAPHTEGLRRVGVDRNPASRSSDQAGAPQKSLYLSPLPGTRIRPLVTQFQLEGEARHDAALGWPRTCGGGVASASRKS